MPAIITRGNHGSVAYLANQEQRLALRMGGIIRDITLYLTGQPTVTGANNTAAKTLRGDEWACVERIDIVANGTQIIRSFSGADLRRFNRFWYGTQIPLTSALGDAATANPSFASTLKIPFALPRTYRPFDSALDTRLYTNLDLVIKWGSETSINADASGWTTNPLIKVFDTNVTNIQARFSQSRIAPIFVTTNAANSNLQVELPMGDFAYHAFLINTYSTISQDQAYLNSVKLYNKDRTYLDTRESGVIRADDAFMGSYQSSQAQDRGTTANLANAWTYFECPTDGYRTEDIDALGLSTLYFELNVSNACTVKILPVQTMPIR